MIIVEMMMYEFNTLENRNEEISVKKIIAVKNTTNAFAQRKPEKMACRDSNPDLRETGAAL